MPVDRRSVYQERTGTYSTPSHASSALFDEKPTLRSPSYKPPFEVGQKVRHGKFGIGVVVACNPLKNDTEVTVAFPGVVGVKKLAQSFAKLEAV
jgi:hypothetical protein